MSAGQSAGTTLECLTELSELVRLARMYQLGDQLEGRPGSAQSWDQLAGKLDSARVTLVQEGDDYLAVAWAFVDSGRLTIGRQLARAARRPARDTLDMSILTKPAQHD